MAGRHRALLVVAMVCGALAGTPAWTPAWAEDVPLPRPAPLAKSGDLLPPAPVPPAPIPSPSSAATPSESGHADSSHADSSHADSGHGSSSGFFPFSVPFLNGGQSDQATAFTDQQRQVLDRVSHYLSSIQTLVGNFVQVAPDGTRTDGTFYLQKPGKIRFEYNAPSPIDVIADGSSVAVRNRDLNTQDLWPLSQTPLRYLLASHIDLMHDTDVVSVSSDDKYITVVVQEKELMVGTSRLKMMFDAKKLTLKQWIVTDPQGLQTTVAVYNLDTSEKPDPSLFVINYQRNPTAGNE
ncbi:MAG: outer membrane lipoprotein carrier protein LolA [Xanthobacteraceae bacterium]